MLEHLLPCVDPCHEACSIFFWARFPSGALEPERDVNCEGVCELSVPTLVG